MEPHWSQCTYLDAGRAVQKDYTDIRAVLNSALNGFAADLGKPLKKEKIVRGAYVCTHVTNFPCLKQSEQESELEAWYVIFQMREYLKDAQQAHLPSDLRDLTTKMANTPDEYVRAEFRRIQRRICTILSSDVITRGGLFFHGHAPPSNRDIEAHLREQRDTRTFNTLEGVRPFPPRL